MKKILLSLCICLVLCGCGSINEAKTDKPNNVIGQTNDEQVSYSEAKELVNNGAIILDVRTKFEYNERHITDAILLPVDDINEETASNIIESKDISIIVYCASGNRSSRAVGMLEDLGYTNVYDLGSIDNWEE